VWVYLFPHFMFLNVVCLLCIRFQDHQSKKATMYPSFKITTNPFLKVVIREKEISNFQCFMHINTFSGRGYSIFPNVYLVFPWVLADYKSGNLVLSNPKTFHRLDKPVDCQTPEGEDQLENGWSLSSAVWFCFMLQFFFHYIWCVVCYHALPGDFVLNVLLVFMC